MKYKVGDRVRIREDLEVGLYKGEIGNEYLTVITQMTLLRGQIVTINKVDDFHGTYRLCEHGYYWTADMFDSNYNENKIFEENEWERIMGIEQKTAFI